MPKPIEDFTGRRYGRLRVREYSGKNTQGKTTWLCDCDCGAQLIVQSYSLKRGDTSSCGCQRRETLSKRHTLYREEIIGRTFAQLRVENISHITASGTFYNCLCSCGNIATVRGTYLTSGHTKSCGCLSQQITLQRNENYRARMVGRRFGRLIVTNIATIGSNRTSYSCVCDCGNTAEIKGTDLTQGNTSSCGCLQRELASQRFTTHGLSKHRLYNIWAGMIQRCTNQRTSSYNYYGAEGVKVCDEWSSNFEAFFNWAMMSGYRDDLTLDRFPNISGDYEPNNCRWATTTDQSRNRKNVKLDIATVVKIRTDPRRQIDIAEEYGISQPTVSAIKLNKIWKTTGE